MTRAQIELGRLFVVIGAMKGGTTSLHDYLGCHPEIFMSRTKELDFFAKEEVWKRGTDWYGRQFNPAFAVFGESSPNYTKYHQFPGVPERMHGVAPHAKLIYVVRDPVDRLLSHYTHNVAAGDERRALGDVLQGDLAENHYVLTSSYYRQLEKFLPFYAADHILIVTSEALRDRRRETLRRIFGFLGVDAGYDDARFDAVRHVSEEKRRPSALSRRLYRLPGGIYARYLLRYVLDTRIEWPEMNRATEGRVREVLAADAERLRAFSGERFAEWSV